ncbi:MAG: TolC family protein [Planctomycetaceae bacterium]|nr:TolC family protein [Planctomycetales bacterium]MCB9923413.1 TolC family protein [Planctomycetaceae bacterium]
MRRQLRVAITFLLAAIVGMPGCSLRKSREFEFDPDFSHYHGAATEVSYPDVESVSYEEIASTRAPLTLREDTPPEFWDLKLDEAIQISLANSQVMRDLGALVLERPENARTLYDPAIEETHPRFGVEAALSAFDASFESHLFFENNDRALNNIFFGGGTRLFQQDLHSYQAQLSKRSATGGEFTLRKIIGYDFNNSPGNDDPNKPWTVQVEGEFRQPLMQGAGVDFNRIAGPDGRPGAMNGVLLARINSDISVADFEIAVRNLVNDVENSYWELYFAYRDLDSKIAARDRALETWRSINALFVTNRRGGEAEKEAQAREQYYRFEEDVQNALAGRPSDNVRTNTLRGAGGVQVTERRLRRLMGITASDGRLIRPAQEPSMARVVFDWEELLVESLNRRAELRRQKWQVKRRELELAASRNFLLPRVDAVGRYRFRGLGEHLINSERQTGRFENAYQDLTTGDFQEWQVGLEVQMPVGYRQGHASVRNAELYLNRERAILEEQEKQVVHGLTEAVAEVDRAYEVSQTSYNRRVAAKQHLDALASVYQDADENEKTRLLDLLLDAQRRLADAETAYYRGLLEYSLAIKNVHLQKGSLLDYNEIYLSEGPWPGKAHYDAARLDESRRNPTLLNYIISWPFPVSRGPVAQRIMPGVEEPNDYATPPIEMLPQPALPADPVPNSETDGAESSAIGTGVLRNATFNPAVGNAPPT